MNNFLASLHDESVDPVFVTDSDLREFEYTNYAFRKFWGSHFEDSESIAESWLDCVPVEDRPILESILDRPDLSQKRKFRIIHPATGEKYWFRVRSRTSSEPGTYQRIGWVMQDVTPRNEPEHLLLQERRRFQQMVQAIDEVLILVDGDFSDVLFMNESGLPRIYGRSPQEIPSDPREAMEQIVHPEDLGNVRKWTNHFLNDPGERESQREFRILLPDESIRWIRQKYFKIEASSEGPARIACVVENITARKNLEQKLARQERRFRRMAETIDQAFFLLTPDYHFLYVNPAFESIYGVSAEQLAEDPMAWTRYVPPSDLESIQTDLDDQRNREVEEVQVQEIRIDRPELETRWIRVKVFPVFDDDGDLYRLVGTSMDITEEKNRKVELERALDQKQALLQEVHHRVKNNMQVISSLLGLEGRRESNRSLREVVLKCQNRIQAMALVHQHLYRDGDLKGSVELGSYLEELATSSLQTGMTDRDLNLEMDFNSSEPDLEIGLDTAVPLGIVVNELITNSLQHGFEGHTNGRISIGINRTPDGFVEVSLRDNGVGLPEDFSWDRVSSLGLNLVKRLVVEQLGGDVHIENGTGARFYLRIPE